ncbi:GntR family transcriptional regulator [Flavobacterium hydrophilum]|uniref:Transcriptional regulator n=1 Tax=Flavobacterium hydrophilum TaxID=2211445 RepID=A0A2V4C749_9FLAO|nr:substrate-binding domain-containing protein [Flavobacterium hydrophilum]PXY46915.1 transcriptional regulator [Flavobacterium hydrophilum]
MKAERENATINLEINSSIPKYIQIANSIADDIFEGKFVIGERLPSIRTISNKNAVSRDTAEKAFKELRDRSLIYSVTGLGNFVESKDLDSNINVFFLINKPCTYKMEIYNSFVSALGEKGQVDMYLYYCDEQLFINAIKKNINNYNYFVIMPHFRDVNQSHINHTPITIKAINSIPKDKLVLLDNSHAEISGSFPVIYQDFKLDVINALNEGAGKLKKYEKIILVYPTKAVFPYPAGLLEGFLEFCSDHQFEFRIMEQIPASLEFTSKDAYIIIEDNDLVNLVQQTKEKKLKIGDDIGIISYNDTPLKVLLDITVLSSDFITMGQKAAEAILTKTKDNFKNPFLYIERNSL